jgi:N-acetylmuramoyl-L-alanine amidase
MSREIEFIYSPNFSSRNNIPIDTIVIHYTASLNINGTISWFQNKKSKVSAHYIVGIDGKIIQMVRHEDKAWHAGISEWNGRKNVNNFSIGIELVATKDSGFTEEQYDATAFLCAKIQKEYQKVFACVGHSDIAPGRKVDPGEHWDWQKFNQKLNEHFQIKHEEPHEEFFDISSNFQDDEDAHIPPGKDTPKNWIKEFIIDFLKKLSNKRINY